MSPSVAAAPGAVAPARRATGFAVVAAVLGLFTSAASAPSPLNGLYDATWTFSAANLAAVFAGYALALLLTLLTTASLSDQVGRRPVVAALALPGTRQG